MSTITYCKGLPIYNNQYNPLGISEFESFLNSYAPIFRLACIETVNMLLSECKSEFDGVADSAWNTLLQQKYKINKLITVEKLNKTIPKEIQTITLKQ